MGYQLVGIWMLDMIRQRTMEHFRFSAGQLHHVDRELHAGDCCGQTRWRGP